jgi:LacI family transcriptional regulator
MVTFPHILQGMRDRAEVERIALDIHYQAPGDLDPASNRQPVFRHIRNGDWRGVLLVYPFAQDAVNLIARKISTVAVGESYDHPAVDSIDTDEVSGIVTLVGKLIASGHQRIGFLTWDYPIGGHWSLQRFGGYVEALFTHGLPFNPEWVLNIHKDALRLTPDQVHDRVISAIRNQGVTAWVCAADHQAYPLVQTLTARGFRVPEDVSVTGFDGLEPPHGMRPVTSMKAPYADIGTSAVGRLLNRITDPHAPRRKILVEASFVPGETIARPAARSFATTAGA